MSKRSLIVFKSSDYDLNEDERKLKYKDYNIIVCEKCNDKFNRGWKCRKCYINETEEEKYQLQEKNQSQSPNASSIIIVETTKTAYTVNSDGCSDCGIVDHLSVIQQGSVHRIEYIEVNIYNLSHYDVPRCEPGSKYMGNPAFSRGSDFLDFFLQEKFLNLL
ncbi:hypothetical protein RhiirA1_439307 [Rhizophagus irregularis]|uniref:Uncharacterized protein n=1 Tax=Rhizophagus irregularis TaxID=588596 RepID=A0A2N0S5A5_9GLOM|nr:hypothetical protein RhiirA1_439307 [Rhizophagus irregularis]